MKTYELVNGIRIQDSDVVNPDNWDFAKEVYIFHDHGFVCGIVLEDNLQDALDELVDADRISSMRIEESDYGDYGVETDNPTCSFLGNAGEPYDIECLACHIIPKPRFSLVAMIAWKGEE
jgi:hypothetical protein